MTAVMETSWGWMPSAAPEATLGCLMEPGSLTERLIASGRRFAVDLLHLGAGVAHRDEAAPLRVAAGAPIGVRHVVLTLDGVPVVAARSYCREGCPVWLPILDRGGRSLGFTLFSGEVALTRGPLEFAEVEEGHPLFALATTRAAGVARFPARRCRFEHDGAALVVCEVFLPALETQLAAGDPRIARAAGQPGR